ncbi:MAG: VanZ family protein [Romboutsia timonensis]|uniref:VanZ family protein n=1 Tax=Romboutsia timonensis TaxID=1776391 RepID=UPI002A762568|nr:VanZ family protein [Romboutsia timonensis]MDY3000931.1 VanZ family protein [Romboutsia timonensis]
MRKKICILLAVLWMGFIFYMSHQPEKISRVQSNNVIRVIKKVSKSEEIKKNINSFVVRKGAHMFLFCVLGILFFGSVYNGDNILKSVFIALLLAFLYACSDEYHQTFVVGRSGQFDDVLIDFIGAFIGVFIVSLIVKLNIFKKKIQVTM